MQESKLPPPTSSASSLQPATSLPASPSSNAQQHVSDCVSGSSSPSSSPSLTAQNRVSPLHGLAISVPLTGPLSVGEITIPQTCSSPFKPPHSPHTSPAPSPPSASHSTSLPPLVIPSVPVPLASVASGTKSPSNSSNSLMNLPGMYGTSIHLPISQLPLVETLQRAAVVRWKKSFTLLLLK